MHSFLKTVGIASLGAVLNNALVADSAAEKMPLKVAVLSDIQHYDQPGDWPYGNFRKALSMLKEVKPDVMLIGGDLVENASHPDVFTSYRKLLQETFGNDQSRRRNRHARQHA